MWTGGSECVNEWCRQASAAAAAQWNDVRRCSTAHHLSATTVCQSLVSRVVFVARWWALGRRVQQLNATELPLAPTAAFLYFSRSLCYIVGAALLLVHACSLHFSWYLTTPFTDKVSHRRSRPRVIFKVVLRVETKVRYQDATMG